MGELNRRQDGISLLGVVVAVVLMASSALATARLVVRSDQAAALAREKFVAANLAREGLELIRWVRDNNHFAADADRSWTSGLCNPGQDEGFTGMRQFAIDARSAHQQGQVIDLSSTELIESLLYLDGEEWTHTITSSPTRYSRDLSVDCSEKAEDLTNPAQPKPAFITVTSRVRWLYRGNEKSVVIKEQLYDWLPTPT